MMNFGKLSLLMCLLTTGSIRLAAQAQDANPVDVQSLLHELNELQQKQKENSLRNREQLVQSLNAAAQSHEKALDLYFDAIMAMNFAGANRENTKFKEWKDKEKDKWQSRAFQTALQFYCYYLSLSIRKAADEPKETFMPSLIGYCRDYMASRDLVRDQDVMKKPVNNFIIANWLQISPILPKAEDWEMTPGNLDGIFEKVVLPYWREVKSPYLLDYWDRRIATEAEDSEDVGLDAAAGKFTQLRRPTLLWSKAQEYFVLGQNNRGITEMFGIIKAYPGHPQFTNWVNTLRSKLSPPVQPEAPPAEQPPGPPQS